MPIQITDLVEAKRISTQGFAGIISIADPWADPTSLGCDDSVELLELRFVDLDEPLAMEDLRGEMVMPAAFMVDQALTFAARHAETPLLIHCHAGISRSTAIGLAVIATRLGAGAEERALDELLTLVPDAVPNLAVVSIADDLLHRKGQLFDAVMNWDRATPRNRLRRELNRAAYRRICMRSG